MKHNVSRAISLFLVLAIALSLGACSNQTAEYPKIQNESTLPEEQTQPSSTEPIETFPPVSLSDVDLKKTAGSFSLGYDHAAAILSDGTVIAAGNNDYDQCNVYDWTGLSQIECGQQFTLGLKLDGTVVATGANSSGQCDVYSWENILSVSAVMLWG